jgi:hypothetical protein
MKKISSIALAVVLFVTAAQAQLQATFKETVSQKLLNQVKQKIDSTASSKNAYGSIGNILDGPSVTMTGGFAELNQVTVRTKTGLIQNSFYTINGSDKLAIYAQRNELIGNSIKNQPEERDILMTIDSAGTVLSYVETRTVITRDKSHNLSLNQVIVKKYNAGDFSSLINYQTGDAEIILGLLAKAHKYKFEHFAPADGSEFFN